MATERKGGGARGQDLGKEERCDVYARHDLLRGLGAVTKHIYTLVLRVYMQHTPAKKTPKRSHDNTHYTEQEDMGRRKTAENKIILD